MKRKHREIGNAIFLILLVVGALFIMLWVKQDKQEGFVSEESASQVIQAPILESEQIESKESTEIKQEEFEEDGQENVEVPFDDEYVEVLDYIPDVVVDLKYATEDNFTGVVIYDFNEAYLRYGTVKKLAVVQEKLKSLGYRIKIWDAYRPFEAQKKLWEVCPDPRYIANPANGMKAHNLGGTIDMTIVTLEGEKVEMPSGFDEFSVIADRDYSDVSEEARNNAVMLEQIMTECGFEGYEGEWWDYSDTTVYEPMEFEP